MIWYHDWIRAVPLSGYLVAHHNKLKPATETFAGVRLDAGGCRESAFCFGMQKPVATTWRMTRQSVWFAARSQHRIESIVVEALESDSSAYALRADNKQFENDFQQESIGARRLITSKEGKCARHNTDIDKLAMARFWND